MKNLLKCVVFVFLFLIICLNVYIGLLIVYVQLLYVKWGKFVVEKMKEKYLKVEIIDYFYIGRKLKIV